MFLHCIHVWLKRQILPQVSQNMQPGRGGLCTYVGGTVATSQSDWGVEAMAAGDLEAGPMSATVSLGINGDHHSRGRAVVGVTGWENPVLDAQYRQVDRYLPLFLSRRVQYTIVWES